MLTEIITIALGLLVGVVLLALVAALWSVVSNIRAEAYVERRQREQAMEMERKGYAWFMGGWVKKGDLSSDDET